MKIDNIVFSCSEYYAPFWNIQSQIWKTKFNIEPICMLFGKQSNIPGMKDTHGEIIEVSFNKDLPDIIQIQFSKFYQPTKEPEKTWLIGDMDQIPLQTAHFLDGLDEVDENAYVHFNYSLIAQMLGLAPKTFLERGANVNGGYDLPGQYHAAKGRMYRELFFPDSLLDEVIRDVVGSNRYGMLKQEDRRNLTPSIHGDYWVAEEMYTSEKIWYGYRKKVFSGFHGREYHISEGKIDRARQWCGGEYRYDREKLKRKGYVDIHCHRPFHEQEKSLMTILTESEMI